MKLLSIIPLLIAGFIAEHTNFQNEMYPFSPAEAAGVWELDLTDDYDDGFTLPDDFRCALNPITVTVDLENMRYASEYGTYRHTADIIRIETDRFWIRYDNETRTDVYGKPVTWAWVKAGKGKFYWVRNDWAESDGNRRTQMRRRCEDARIVSHKFISKTDVRVNS
jgi:hypothetical protein